jgi:hypothetical protein
LSFFPIILILLIIDFTDWEACCTRSFNSTSGLNALLYISINSETLIRIIHEGEGESSNHYRDFISAKGIIRWL